MQIPERFKSRKLWVAVVTAVLLAVSEALSLNIDPDTMNSLALVISSYLIGQSAVDWSKSRENASKYAAWMATQMQQVSRYPEFTGDHEE